MQLALLIRIHIRMSAKGYVTLSTRFPFFDTTRNATLNILLPLLRITLLLLRFFFRELHDTGWDEGEPYQQT
jgi:hypothetical protein